MEAGFARLNELTIIQLSHGMAHHILNELDGKSINGVAIGFDGRYNSKRLIILLLITYKIINFFIYLLFIYFFLFFY